MRPVFVLALALALLGSRSGAEPRYRVTNLGTLGGGYSDAHDINDRGWVVGTSSNAAGMNRAFVWRNGVMVELGVLPGGRFSQASAINNMGWVAGTSEPGPARAVLWRNGQMTDLGGPLGVYHMAHGINNQGQVVGNSFFQGRSTAWLWHDGARMKLPSLGDRAGANAINDWGQIVGGSNLAPGSPDLHAVLWSDNALYDLGTLGGASSNAFAINNLGWVAGQAERADGLRHAFLWDAQFGMFDLGALPGDRHSVAMALNDVGQVVGYSWLDNSLQSRAVLWQDGEIVDLNSVIRPGSGWQLTYAWGLNNQRQIVGLGRHEGRARGFLLSPLPRAIPVETQRLPKPRP